LGVHAAARPGATGEVVRHTEGCRRADHARAAADYAEAADRWERFGNEHERAYALLGHGRCLVALGELGAEHPLREAYKLFESMGYEPASTETETVLERAAAPTP